MPVLSPQCKPVANALLDFWHCDEAGDYDNRGFRYRGHVLADAQGRYSLETIVPGEYPGRTRHIHVKVQAPGGRVLTTQLYFPDEPGNRSDGIYRRELTMQVTRRAGGTTRDSTSSWRFRRSGAKCRYDGLLFRKSVCSPRRGSLGREVGLFPSLDKNSPSTQG